MPRRFTITEKWGRPWFMELTPQGKLMFQYLYDNCDIAGFWEKNTKLAAFQTGLREEEVDLTLMELSDAYYQCGNGRYLWLMNFIKDQKNLPLNARNAAHRGIIAILNSHPDIYEKTKILLDPTYCEEPLFHIIGAAKGLGRGSGKDKGKGNRGGLGGRKNLAQEAKLQKERLFKWK